MLPKLIDKMKPRKIDFKYIPSVKPIQNIQYAKIYPEFEYRLNFDGCSKGNPGLGGAGAVIYKGYDEICNTSIFVGNNVTNNYSEYSGLILGLQKAIDLNITTLLVQGDSQIVINQMNGTYKCSSDNLKPLYEKAKELEQNFEKIYYQHIFRNLNKRADELANNFVNKNNII
jgi:ribonuclease HI